MICFLFVYFQRLRITETIAMFPIHTISSFLDQTINYVITFPKLPFSPSLSPFVDKRAHLKQISIFMFHRKTYKAVCVCICVSMTAYFCISLCRLSSYKQNSFVSWETIMRSSADDMAERSKKAVQTESMLTFHSRHRVKVSVNEIPMVSSSKWTEISHILCETRELKERKVKNSKCKKRFKASFPCYLLFCFFFYVQSLCFSTSDQTVVTVSNPRTFKSVSFFYLCMHDYHIFLHRIKV